MTTLLWETIITIKQFGLLQTNHQFLNLKLDFFINDKGLFNIECFCHLLLFISQKFNHTLKEFLTVFQLLSRYEAFIEFLYTRYLHECCIQLQNDLLFSAKEFYLVLLLTTSITDVKESSPLVSIDTPKFNSVRHTQNDLPLILVFAIYTSILHLKYLLLDLILLVEHALSLCFKVV